MFITLLFLFLPTILIVYVLGYRYIPRRRRIRMYKQAIKDYTEYASQANQDYSLNGGFCLYFKDKYNIYTISLPELRRTRLRTCSDKVYWYPPGIFGVHFRLQNLKAALKLAEKRWI